MQFTPLQPIDNTELFVSGDVKIDPSVAIASGVILQAASDCQIVIAAGVCIGMGAILHAYQGNIEVESGVTIGAGVLVVGKSKIGANACIGSVATIIEYDIEPKQVVPPTSIMGESGRQISGKSTTSPSPLPPETAPSPKTTTTNSDDNLSVSPELTNSSQLTAETLPQKNTFNSPIPPINNQELSSSEFTQETLPQKNTFNYPVNNQGLSNNYQFFKKTEPDNNNSSSLVNTEPDNNNSSSLVNQELTNTSSSPDPEETPHEIEQAKTQLQEEEEATETTNTPIYGQEYVNRMMKTLFPHKNTLSSPPDEED